MAVNLPNGSIISVASTYATSRAMSALTNADPAVATLASAHGVQEGDVVEVTSGWSKLSGRIVRAGTVSSDDVDLEGFDSSSTAKYPAGSGTGSVREISAWTQVSQIVDFASQGGEQQFTTYSFLEDSTERQIPTVKSAQSFTLNLGDDQTLPWYDVLKAADEDQIPRAIRIVLASGAVIYYNAYVTLNTTPSLTKNEIMTLSATFSFAADPTRYAS